MLKAVIIDDEARCVSTLKQFLEKFCPEVKLLATADNVANGIDLLKRSNPDIVFLDIQMPDGTGFDVLDAQASIEFQIVFTTAHDMYAIKAFRYSAIDYLLKPINPEELVQAVSKIPKENSEQIEERVKMLLDSRNQQNFKRLAIRTTEGTKFLELDKILRLQADGSYTHIFSDDGSKLMTSRGLKEYDQMLSDKDFVRIHQSHIVAFGKIVELKRGDELQVELSDGSSVPVARRRKALVMERLGW